MPDPPFTIEVQHGADARKPLPAGSFAFDFPATLPRWHPGDCMTVAAMLIAGLPYNRLPDPHAGGPVSAAAYWQAWDQWAAAHGCWWWKSTTVAPAYLDRWIALVDVPGYGDLFHAVAMRGAEPVWDRLGLQRVDPADIREAHVLLRQGAELPPGPAWQINRRQVIDLRTHART